MAERKTERSSCRFAVQQSAEGKPFLVISLYQDTIPMLRKVEFGFDLLGGAGIETAAKLADMLNEHVLNLFVTTDEATGDEG